MRLENATVTPAADLASSRKAAPGSRLARRSIAVMSLVVSHLVAQAKTGLVLPKEDGTNSPGGKAVLADLGNFATGGATILICEEG
jgi:hypothetical protein